MFDFERKGYVNNVTFAEGLAFFKGDWYLYYGAADTCIGLAIIDDLNEILFGDE